MLSKLEEVMFDVLSSLGSESLQVLAKAQSMTDSKKAHHLTWVMSLPVADF